MPIIRFSYIFDDEIERVFREFIFVSSSLRLSFKNSLSDLIFYEGSKFDDENCQFSFKWKNYYTLKMISEKIIKTQFYKSFTHSSINIDKVPLQIKLTFDFFWDSVNEKTILIILVSYEDDFFTELINSDFTENDKLIICKMFEDYLKKSLKGVELGYSFLLNTGIKNIINYILYPKLFFELMSNQIRIFNEQQIELDNKYELLMKDEETNNLVPLIILEVENLIITNYYAKITYNTRGVLGLPKIKITFIFQELANKKCILMFIMKPPEPISHETNCRIFKIWKRKLKNFWSHFEIK